MSGTVGYADPEVRFSRFSSAAPFAATVTRCLAGLGRHLTQGARSVRDSADGLVDSTDTYHRLEEAATNTFNPFR